MPQGSGKKLTNQNQKNNKKAQNQTPKRVWKKRKDPVRAAIVRKVEACAMAKALIDPMKGAMHLVKPTEEKAKRAKVSTKALIRNPHQKIK